MQIERFCEGLLSFLQASPTPFHAVQTMALALEQTGFEYLDEAQDWNYPTSGNYYTIRNDASLIAFRLGDGDDTPQANSNSRLGFNMVGAHTDSPGLKVKPNPDHFREDYWQLGVEVYGSPLLHTWFDRDLSLAGRVHYIDENNGLYRTLVDFEHPIATIPSLAIHLNREANSKSSINAQKHILPVLMQTENTEAFSLKSALLERLKLCTDHNPKEVLDFDLHLYDSQAPRMTGFAQEFVASARLDNLLSCYVGLMSLLNSDPSQRSLLVCTDHEEVGSQSACGAQGPFLADTLKRLFPDYETYCQCIAQSFLISVDNAHAVHPNYADRHDPKHAPRMNHGPVIKINANQRYATTSETSAVVQYLAQVVEVPLQSFVTRSDLACGSTIGPITSAEIGVRTVDMGVPQFAMHSAREMASKDDTHALYKLLNAFFSLPSVPSAQAIRPTITPPAPNAPQPEALPEEQDSDFLPESAEQDNADQENTDPELGRNSEHGRNTGDRPSRRRNSRQSRHERNRDRDRENSKTEGFRSEHRETSGSDKIINERSTVEKSTVENRSVENSTVEQDKAPAAQEPALETAAQPLDHSAQTTGTNTDTAADQPSVEIASAETESTQDETPPQDPTSPQSTTPQSTTVSIAVDGATNTPETGNATTPEATATVIEPSSDDDNSSDTSDENNADSESRPARSGRPRGSRGRPRSGEKRPRRQNNRRAERSAQKSRDAEAAKDNQKIEENLPEENSAQSQSETPQTVTRNERISAESPDAQATDEKSSRESSAGTPPAETADSAAVTYQQGTQQDAQRNNKPAESMPSAPEEAEAKKANPQDKSAPSPVTPPKATDAGETITTKETTKESTDSASKQRAINLSEKADPNNGDASTAKPQDTTDSTNSTSDKNKDADKPTSD